MEHTLSHTIVQVEDDVHDEVVVQGARRMRRRLAAVPLLVECGKTHAHPLSGDTSICSRLRRTNKPEVHGSVMRGQEQHQLLEGEGVPYSLPVCPTRPNAPRCRTFSDWIDPTAARHQE